MQDPLKLAESIPEYLQIQLALQTQIEEGVFTLGERLPSDKALANAYGVSIGTVVKSISNLAAQGLVKRVQGKGTFVADAGSSPHTGRFYRRRRGFLPGARELDTDTRLEALTRHDDFNALFPDKPYFGPGPVPVFELRRRTERDGVLYSLLLCFFPATLCPNLDRIPAEVWESQALHRIFRERYGLTTCRVCEMSGVGFPGDAVAALWGDRITEPYLCIESLDYAGKGRPYIYRTAALFHNDYKLYREF